MSGFERIGVIDEGCKSEEGFEAILLTCRLSEITENKIGATLCGLCVGYVRWFTGLPTYDNNDIYTMNVKLILHLI